MSRFEPKNITTEKLRSYGVAHRELIPEIIHDFTQYSNDKAELSHQPTRVREWGMHKFKSITQAQNYLNTHAAVGHRLEDSRFTRLTASV
ncbi:MAG: DDE-type integrase/transposase/recombinase [Gammaproteobacteria bacterium]